MSVLGPFLSIFTNSYLNAPSGVGLVVVAASPSALVSLQYL
jgi:hypothetical protein